MGLPRLLAGWLVLVLPKKTSITARLRCRRSIIVIVVFWASSYSLVVVFYSSPSCRSGSATKDKALSSRNQRRRTSPGQSRADYSDPIRTLLPFIVVVNIFDWNGIKSRGGLVRIVWLAWSGLAGEFPWPTRFLSSSGRRVLLLPQWDHDTIPRPPRTE